MKLILSEAWPASVINNMNINPFWLYSQWTFCSQGKCSLHNSDQEGTLLQVELLGALHFACYKELCHGITIFVLPVQYRLTLNQLCHSQVLLQRSTSLDVDLPHLWKFNILCVPLIPQIIVEHFMTMCRITGK